MTRQHTTLNQRLGQANRLHASPFGVAKRIHPQATRTGPLYKSPIGLELQAKRGVSRLSKKTPILSTITEEDEEEETERDLHSAMGVFGNRGLDEGYAASGGWEKSRTILPDIAEEDEDMMEWDEERTLVALLKEDYNHEDEEKDMNELVEKLRSPMNAQSQELKRYMVETIFPVVQRVKEVHETLEEDVDLAYGTGLLAFDEVCKRVEALALKTEDDTRTGYIDSQKRMKGIVAQLTDAYRRRDSLWTELEANLEKCADRARTAAEGIPEAVESTISRLEKKNKEMEKSVTSHTTKQKMLKDLLGRL